MQELATYNVEESNDALVVSQHLGELLSLGEALVKSGLTPKEVRTPEAAAAIILKGRELSLPPMLSLSHIFVINGKPTLSAEVMLAMILRSGHDVWFSETTAERATIHGIRRNSTREQTLTWTIQEAQSAGLMGNTNWKKYAPAMLRARAISAFARMFAPDVVMGAYTPEELGADVNERGEYLGVTGDTGAGQNTARGVAGLQARLAAQKAPEAAEDDVQDAEFTPAPEEDAEPILRISGPQATAIAIALKEAGFKATPEDRPNGRRFVAWLAGIDGTLESSSELTREQAAAVLERLGDGENGAYRTDAGRLAEALTGWHDHLDLQRSPDGPPDTEQEALPGFDPNERPGNVKNMKPIDADESTGEPADRSFEEPF